MTFETVGNVLTSMGYLAVESPNFAQLHSSVWELLARDEVVHVKNLIVFVAAATNTYVDEKHINSRRSSQCSNSMASSSVDSKIASPLPASKV